MGVMVRGDLPGFEQLGAALVVAHPIEVVLCAGHVGQAPGVAAVKEAEAAHNSEESRKNLLRRVVAFNPTYSPNEVGELLGIAVARVKLLMQQGKIGCVRIGKRRSGKGEYEIFRITGWQLIDFLENAQESGEI